jgi:hypothetical protein
MSKSPITPTLGRVIWASIQGADYAAIIVRPDLGDDVIAVVFNAPVTSEGVVSLWRLPYDETGQSEAPSWRWMPYQLGQAAKTEELIKERTDRPDFGVLGAVDETLNAAGLEPVETLPSSPLLCATLDEVRRFAESQGKGRYSPESDRRVALDLIAAMAGIMGRPVPHQEPPAEFDEPKADVDWIGLEARTRALDMAIRARPGFSAEHVIKDAEMMLEFLGSKPASNGKVYATRADVDCLHERIDNLSAEMQRAVSGA